MEYASMEGTLEKVPITKVLQGLHRGKSTGVLHLSRGDATKRVYFKDGAIVFASSDVGDERLGELLVRAGKLSRVDLHRACEAVERSRRRLGETLVELGHMSEEELDACVKEQVEAIVYSLLPWDSGFYRAELSDQPVDEDLLRRDLSTQKFLIEGIRRIEDMAAVRRGIGDLDAALAFATDPSDIGAHLPLTPEDGFVLSRVDGVASVSEIAQMSPMGEEQTLRCIYALMVAGLLELKRSEAKARPKPEPAPAPAPSSTAEPRVETEALSPEADRFRREMIEKHARAASSTHYQLLGISPKASTEEIKSAYFKLAKKLHPDHRAGLKIRDPDGVFDQLYLKIKAAYEVLVSPTGRRRYDFSLEQQTQKRGEGEGSSNKTPSDSEDQGVPKRTYSAVQMARLHFANGQRFFEDGRYHEAIEELRDAVRLDGSRAEYHRLLGKALGKNPKWRKQAEEHYRKAIAMNRFDAASYLELGELYEAGGLETRATKMYEEALGLDPGNPRALEKLERNRTPSRLSRLKNILNRGKGH